MIRDGHVEHEMVYPHPPERVWRALTDAGELKAWLMPTTFVAEVGRHFTFDAQPTFDTIHGEVLEVDPPKLLRCRWSGPFGDTVVTFELSPEPDGTGTRLRLRHSGWTAENAGDRPGFDSGWGEKLTNLATLLNGIREAT